MSTHASMVTHVRCGPCVSVVALPPGAGPVLARATVRRAERLAVALGEAEQVNAHALAYLNRLSDHLFVAARSHAASEGGDVLWQPGATRNS